MNQLEQIIKEHICRFNDEPQVCECFVAGVKAGEKSIDKKIISQLAYDDGYKAGQEAERGSQNKIFKTLRLILHDIQSYEPEGEVNTLCEQGLLELNLINSKE